MLDHFLDPVEPTPPITARRSSSHISHRERDDAYIGTIVQFSPRWRLILCKDKMQWIIQKKESCHRGFWRSKQYFTCKDSVLEASGRLGLLSDPTTEAAIYALPEHVSQLAKK